MADIKFTTSLPTPLSKGLDYLDGHDFLDTSKKNPKGKDLHFIDLGKTTADKTPVTFTPDIAFTGVVQPKTIIEARQYVAFLDIEWSKKGQTLYDQPADTQTFYRRLEQFGNLDYKNTNILYKDNSGYRLTTPSAIALNYLPKGINVTQLAGTIADAAPAFVARMLISGTSDILGMYVGGALGTILIPLPGIGSGIGISLGSAVGSALGEIAAQIMLDEAANGIYWPSVASSFICGLPAGAGTIVGAGIGGKTFLSAASFLAKGSVAKDASMATLAYGAIIAFDPTQDFSLEDPNLYRSMAQGIILGFAGRGFGNILGKILINLREHAVYRFNSFVDDLQARRNKLPETVHPENEPVIIADRDNTQLNTLPPKPQLASAADVSPTLHKPSIAPYRLSDDIIKMLELNTRADETTLTLRDQTTRLTQARAFLPDDEGPTLRPEELSNELEFNVSEGKLYKKYNNVRGSATRFVPHARLDFDLLRTAYNILLSSNGYWAFGGDFGITGELGRFYLSVRGTHANDYLKAVNGIYEEASALGYKTQFKVPIKFNDYERSDAGVIYFEAKHQEWFYHKVTKMLEENPEWLADSRPLFTARVCAPSGKPIPGLSFAIDPGRRSFGQIISWAIQDALDYLRRSKSNNSFTNVEVIEAVKTRLTSSGIPPAHPAFLSTTCDGNPGLEVFRFMFGRTDQGNTTNGH